LLRVWCVDINTYAVSDTAQNLSILTYISYVTVLFVIRSGIAQSL